MLVQLKDFLDATWHDKRGIQAPLNTKDHALRTSDADSRTSQLNSLNGILDLEQTAFWAERVYTSIVL
jgi:hypothetical protein